MKQPVYHPLTLEEEVISLFAGSRGYLDKIEVKDIKDFEEFLLNKTKTEKASYLREIRDSKIISDELEKNLSAFIDNVVNDFLANKKTDNTLVEEKTA